MASTVFHQAVGVGRLRRRPVQIALLLVAIAMGGVMGIGGIKLALPLAVIPLGLLFMGAILVRPQIGLWCALCFSFFAAGFSRYLDLPWGLMIDIILFLALLGWGVRQILSRDWRLVNNGALIACALWFVYVILELFNPESIGAVAWFYAMRAMGFYLIIGFVLTFTYLRKPKHFTYFLELIFAISVLGALWGMKQKFVGTDAAEDYWLYVLGHHDEHLLHGVLRAFSFYSDAGQFGAAQIMITLMAGILLLGPFSLRRKCWYALVAVLTLFGFFYSGARGALAIPFAGGLLYMFLSKNFKILALGLLGLGLCFAALKYTYLLQGFQPVARIRTALSADNPSLNARLNNQKILGTYLAERPLGGGIGSAGYWGERFAPGTLLAMTPTDSYYVRVWVETGLVGLILHLFLLGYFLGKGSAIAWRLTHPRLRAQVLAMVAAYGGVLLANYGNQVFLQFPTGIMMAVGLPLIFMAPYYETKLQEMDRLLQSEMDE